MSRTAKNITTEKHYALFQAEVARCCKLWRIVGWRVEFKHERTDDDCRASVRSDAKSHVAVIVLNKDWKHDALTTEKVIRAARHETVHLLVDELDEIAQFRYVTNDQRVHALESVVRHLEDILP